jgi:hypothetical protein
MGEVRGFETAARWTTCIDGNRYWAVVNDIQPDGDRVSWNWTLRDNDHFVTAGSDDRIGSPSYASERSVLASLASFLDAWLAAGPDSENADLFPESARFFEDVIEEFALDMMDECDD